MGDDVEQKVAEHQEEESLDDVDVGLPVKTVVDIYARERLNFAQTYQLLSVRFTTAEGSEAANKGVGNKKEAEKYRDQAQAIAIDMKHCLRSIKQIDKMCPAAKIKMQEMLK